MTLNKKKYVSPKLSPKLENYKPLTYSANSLELKLSQEEQLATTKKLLAS
ncbi:MAG: hypothetical protein ACRC1Z_15675 [Waterburya sp.]